MIAALQLFFWVTIALIGAMAGLVFCLSVLHSK